MPSTPLPNPIHWSEGMLLSPQHLQQHDIANQAYLNLRMALASPHATGVSTLLIDYESLALGLVRITQIECLLDDGYAVSYPGNYGELKLECDVSAILKQSRSTVRIWLALPRRGIDDSALERSDKRFSLLPGDLTADENLDNTFQVNVVRMQARLRLIAGASVPPQFAACALLEVERDTQGRYRLTSYHPPMTRLGASAFQTHAYGSEGLQTRLNVLVNTLWNTLREMAGHPTEDGPEDTLETGSVAERRRAMARHLAAMLPQFELAASSADSHPEVAYRALSHVVGHCAAIGANPIPLKMEPYQHQNCMPQFIAALNYVNDKLKLIDAAWDCLDFARYGENGFARRLPANVHKEIIIELKPRDGQTLAGLTQWINEARIANMELMTELRRRRLHGARARALSAAEIAQRNLRTSAAIFVIENDTIDIEGRGKVRLFSPDSSLLIEGMAGPRMPAAILLYQDKRRFARIDSQADSQANLPQGEPAHPATMLSADGNISDV